MKNNNKGFSLVELIVVIAIMAVLVGVLAPTLLRYVEKSRAQKDASAAEEARNAVVLACADETVYEAVGTGCTVTVTDNTVITDNIATPNTGKLADEVKGTVGEKIDFTSKTYAGKTYTITVTIDSNGVVTANGVFGS